MTDKAIAAFIKAKRDCLDLTDNSEYFSADKNTHCPVEWDGYVCWKSTQAGHSASASCPGRGATQKVVTRHCSDYGQWEDALSSCKSDSSSSTMVPILTNEVIEVNSSGPDDFLSTVRMDKQQTTFSDLVDDDHVFESTSASPSPVENLNFPSTTQEPMTSNGGFIYDYYEQIDIIRALVNCISVILLLTAIVFWCVIWCKSRYGHPYRCVSLICILVFSLLYHSVGVVTLLVYVPDGIGCQCILTLKSYGDIGMYTFCFMYVLLCIGVAMRRLESGAKFYSLVAVAIILPLILVASTTALRVLRHRDAYCDLLDELAHYLWYDRAPKTFLLFGTICVLAVVLYWLCCFDNSAFKLNRDFLLIRHSSVTLMILVCYCFFLELYEIVFLRNTIDGEIKSNAVARNGLILNILMCAKGSLAAALLCFFDIEIFALIYTFPCCPDLGNAIIDQSWEKRIRSESKVKFFEDSSSDEKKPSRSGSSRNPFAKSVDNKKVLPDTQVIQGYGSVDHDDQQTP